MGGSIRKLVGLALIATILLTIMFLIANIHTTLAQTTQPTSSPTPITTSTPVPTPTPPPKVMPGSPLSLGGQSFAEALSQFDITQIAKLVLIALGAMWSIIILVYVGRHFGHKEKVKK